MVQHPQSIGKVRTGEVPFVAWRKQPSRIPSGSTLALLVLQTHPYRHLCAWFSALVSKLSFCEALSPTGQGGSWDALLNQLKGRSFSLHKALF